MVLNEIYIFNIGQKIIMRNMLYHTCTDGIIIKITKHYLLCKKFISFNDEDNNNEDNNEILNTYGRYSKKKLLGNIDDSTLIRIYKNNAYTLEKQELIL